MAAAYKFIFNLTCTIVLILLTNVLCESSNAEVQNDCKLSDVNGLISREIEAVIPAVSARIWEPLSILQAQLKSKLRRLLLYMKSISDESQTVGDSPSKPRYNKNKKPNPREIKNRVLSDEDQSTSERSTESSRYLIRESLEAISHDLFTQIEAMVDQLEKRLTNSSSKIEETVTELTIEFERMIHEAFAAVQDDIKDMNQRLEAIEKVLHC